MEVEVTELFAPQAGKRPANFVVMKYFLLGMLLSNGIESILIVPKTLSLMDDNEHQLHKLEKIWEEHDAFKAQLHEYNQLVSKVETERAKTFDEIVGEKNNPKTHRGTQHHPGQTPVLRAIANHKHAAKEREKKAAAEPFAQPNKLVEIMLLFYGIITLALGIVAVFREIPKLLMLFIGIVALGLVMLFFSGLTLLVFMAILNDVIIALISYQYLKLMNAPCETEYYAPGAAAAYGPSGIMVGGDGQYPAAGQWQDPSYNVDLNAPTQ